MEVLRHFHLLTLQGKLPGYSFLKALELQTDNTGLSPPPVSPSIIVTLFNSR